MRTQRYQVYRGFTLTELAVVLSIVGIVIGAIWSYAQKARQNAKVEQSIEAISQIVDLTRTGYEAQPNIGGGIYTVMNNLTQIGAFPQQLLNSNPTLCGAGANNKAINYASTPWGMLDSAGVNDPCGTLHVCDWSISSSNVCATGITSNQSQYFAIEFDGLDYGSCINLVESMSATQPTGLYDVWINSESASAMSTTVGITPGALPVTPTNASTLCVPGTAANSFPNLVDFIYSLRPPLS